MDLYKGLEAHRWFLTSLTLVSTGLSGKDLAPVLQLMAEPPGVRLQQLNLSHNALGATGTRALADALCSPCCRLSRLSVADSGLTASSHSVISRWSEAMRTATTLASLDMCHNSDATELAEAALAAAARLEVLAVAGCGLRDDELTAWAESEDAAQTAALAAGVPWPKASRLARLDLGFNRFECDGWSALGDALLRHSSLTSLVLGGLAASGSEALVPFFTAAATAAEAQALRRLDLRHLDVPEGRESKATGDACVRWLARACQLHYLNLEGCDWLTSRVAARVVRRVSGLFLGSEDGCMVAVL